jgi:four helix bundle protein
MSNSFRDLEIYKESFRLYFEVQVLSKMLPKHETYELGSQLRRSADSIVTNIVEGYGRRNYKPEFERFLTFSHSSINETICHLEKVNKLYPIHDELTFKLIKEYDLLARKVYRFLKFVEEKWMIPKKNPKTLIS